MGTDLSFYTLDLDDDKASQYQAHAALSRLRPDDALKKMLIVLQGLHVDLGQLYTCPLAASAEQKPAYGALGAMRPFPDSDFIFISAKGQTLANSGVKIVALKDTLEPLIEGLSKTFENVIFVTASNLNTVIE